ncbi:MAG: ThiF family adenylyltransferase [Candidatus Anammoxibacter sp.]
MKSDNYDMERYSRQILFEGIGAEGQKRLRDKYAVIAGCGALGSVIANLLARGGVGRLKIVDRDFVDESNLQRQMLFDEEDVVNDIPKAVAAQKKLQKINSNIVIEAVVSDINYSNVEELTKGADIVLDGLDNFETRFLLNDCCVKHNIPWIYGACVGSSGLTMNVIPGITPCLRCIFETAPPPGTSPTCDTTGIIAPIANIIASIQVTEAFKILTGNLDAINRELIRIDVWDNKYDKINVKNAKDASNCPACKNANFEFLDGNTGSLTTTLCGRNAVQIRFGDIRDANFKDIANRLREIGDVHYNDFILKFKIDGYEITLFKDSRALIFGTNDTVTAKNLYAKYIGM